MNHIDITFGIVCYNQEKLIVQSLSSIKNQIIKYGRNLNYQIIIADDASTDHTVDVVNEWLMKNGFLFTDIVKLYNEKNLGTAKNFVSLLRCISGDYHLVIAGDDLIADNDVVGLILRANENTIVHGVVIPFNDKGIIRDKVGICDRLTNKYLTKKEVYNLRGIRNFTPNGSIVSNSLYDEKVYEFIEEFDLLEDAARSMSVIENTTTLDMLFSDEVIILYRQSDNQVMSHVNNELHRRYIDDKKRLYLHIKHNNSNLLLRFSCWCGWIRMKYPMLYKTILRWIDYYGNLKYLKYISNYRLIKENFEKICSSDKLKKQNEFISVIKENNI